MVCRPLRAVDPRAGTRTIPRFKIGPLARYFHVDPSVFMFEKKKARGA